MGRKSTPRLRLREQQRLLRDFLFQNVAEDAMACTDLVLCGAGDPEGSITATVGYIYLRTDGSTDSTFYVKESGSGNTGWVAKGVSASVTSALAALDTRLDTAETDIDALEAADVALDARLDTAEADITALETADTALDTRLDAIEANNWVTTARIADGNVTLAKVANVATDRLIGRDTAGAGVPEELTVGGGVEFTGSGGIQRSALTGDVTASAGSGSTTIANDAVTNAKLADMAANTFKANNTGSSADPADITVAQAKTLLAIGASDVSGLATVATSGSASDLGTGTLPAGRMPALTGDVTTSAGAVATTIGANKVTNSMLAQVSTATFKGRTTAGSGNVEDLTATQATALLNACTGTTKGLVPAPPNNTTTFLRGDSTFAAPKQKMIFTFGCDTVTAGTTDRYLNPVGYSTTPAGTTSYFYVIPVSGFLIQTQVLLSTVHTTNTFTVSPRLSGVEQTTQQVSLSANVGTNFTTHATPLAVTAGDYLSCQVDHNGATNIRFATVNFVIEY